MVEASLTELYVQHLSINIEKGPNRFDSELDLFQALRLSLK